MPEHTPAQPRSTAKLAFTTLSGFLRWVSVPASRRALGTAGSLAALPLAVPLLWLPPYGMALFLVLAFLWGILCCGLTSRNMAVQDPGAIVWDEIVAMWLVLAFVPRHWGWWLAAFLLFRLFDIAKPWPIHWFDRNVKGGLGIMLDDLVAAVYAVILLVPAARFLPGLMPA